MGFAASTLPVWTVPPDWKDGVEETLSWMTDVLTATATASTQHRSLRLGPRRSFTFRVLAHGQERRVTDMLMHGHAGLWELPIWPDMQWLPSPVAAGSTQIPCATAGFDFQPGGRAMLHAGVTRWEVVTVQSIQSDRIIIASPTTAAYQRGARLCPIRRARLVDADERVISGDVSRRTLTFEAMEGCDWPALSLPSYRGHAVLDRRPDESDERSQSVTRLIQSTEAGAGQPFVHDLPGIGLRMQKAHWRLFGRAERSWFRSLLYTLDGRRLPIWLPSFTDDLRLVTPIPGSQTVLSVEWAGYSLYGQARRRDVRIELADGRVLYRRITACAEVGDTESLTLDAALDSASIDPGQIRQISFMALCTLASDQVEIEHATDGDGLATSTLGWQEVVADV